MNESIPIDASQEVIDKMNARRYHKATEREVLEFRKYPYGLPRRFETGIVLMEKLTGKLWTIKQLSHPEWHSGKGIHRHTYKAQPWLLENDQEVMEIWGERNELAQYFEAPEIASCPDLWKGHGI